ncbi:MAG: cytochrome C oxidase subunit IV family protein [Planctomycetota bacterium]
MHAHDSGHDQHGFSHVMPIKGLLAIFFALVGLTVATVVAAQLPTGRFDIVVAMVIAVIKALIVATWFMHLRHDKVLNIIAFAGSLFFVILFLGFAMLDKGQYESDLARNAAITAPR